MDIRDKTKLNTKIEEILIYFQYEFNDEISRNKIGYEIMSFLETEQIKWETLNLYTPPEKIDDGIVNICIDDEYYPFNKIERISK